MVVKSGMNFKEFVSPIIIENLSPHGNVNSLMSLILEKVKLPSAVKFIMIAAIHNPDIKNANQNLAVLK